MKSKPTLSDMSAEILSSLALHPFIRNYLIKFFKIYFRLNTTGLENIPKYGPVLIIPNHSGFGGLDAIILAHEIWIRTDRRPKVMTHYLWFLSKTISIPLKRLGFIEATSKNGINSLKNGDLVILFPEGERGNFKPTSKKYQLQEFKRGFVRWAIEAQCPIVPTLIIGAEESQLNITTMELPFFIERAILPLPLNFFPLPSKWKISFLAPIYLPYHPSSSSNNSLVHEITADIQENMQSALTIEIQSRKSIYI